MENVSPLNDLYAESEKGDKWSKLGTERNGLSNRESKTNWK